MSHRQPLCLVAVLCAALTVVNACAGDEAPAPSTTVAPTTTQVPTVDDGVLTIGVILPSSGAGAELGQGLNGGVDLAVTEINSAGGTNGTSVRRIELDEGTTPAEAATAMQDLVDAGVDAVIGPASSNAALAALGRAVDAGVAVCSPTAASLALDDFPDNGLFFRTIPSDSLQAEAIAQAVDRTGTATAVLAVIDDPYGRPIGTEVSVAVRALGIEVPLTVPFTAQEESLAAAAEQIAAESAAVVVVIGDATTGPAMLAAIDLAVGKAADGVSATRYIVNDAMRRPAATVQPYLPDLARRVTGVSPQATVDNPTFAEDLAKVDAATSGLYAANAYDCVNLIALAAVAAGSNSAARFAPAIINVSVNGSSCDRFGACRDELESGLNIDYDGPGGALSLNTKGDRETAIFELFGFDSSGRDITLGRLLVSDR